MRRHLLLLGCLLILLLPACQNPGDGQLTVAFPLETTELAGGQSLRVTITLTDHDGQPIEEATVQAELRAPNGSVLTTLSCVDQGQGRYLADYAQLPLQGAKGTWHVAARATWGDDKQAQTERAFKGLPSLSEQLLDEYGFWIEIPRSYDCADSGLQHQDVRNEDGSGQVLINNHCHGSISISVYWQDADFPADEAAAIAIVQDKTAILEPNTGVVLDHRDLLDPNLEVEQTTFQGQPAWLVRGRWEGAPPDRLGTSGYLRNGTAEWMILRCPGSNWLWTVVIAITGDNDVHMDGLRVTRESFACPTP